MTRLDHKEDVFVELIDFGDTPGDELVTQNEDGSYTILLNARSSFERQQDACLHACWHIDNLDFEKGDVQTIESDAHKKEE